MTVKKPKTAKVPKLNKIPSRFFSLKAWKVPTTAKTVTSPKITINKFIKDTPFDIRKVNVAIAYSSSIVIVIIYFVE